MIDEMLELLDGRGIDTEPIEDLGEEMEECPECDIERSQLCDDHADEVENVRRRIKRNL